MVDKHAGRKVDWQKCLTQGMVHIRKQEIYGRKNQETGNEGLKKLKKQEIAK